MTKMKFLYQMLFMMIAIGPHFFNTVQAVSLKDCPNDPLIVIAAFADQNALMNFARTGKRYYSIVKEIIETSERTIKLNPRQLTNAQLTEILTGNHALLKNVQSLDLSCVRFDPQLLKLIPSSIVILNLHHSYGMENFTILERVVRHRESNGMRWAIPTRFSEEQLLYHEAFAQAIVHAILQWTHLLKIDLSGNRLGNLVIRVIATAAHHWPNLVEINLSENQVSDTGAQAILEAAHQDWKKLSNIDLSHNQITLEAIPTIVSVALQFQNLSKIDLSWNSATGTELIEMQVNLKQCYPKIDIILIH